MGGDLRAMAGRVAVDGLPLDAVDVAQTMAIVDDACQTGRRLQIVTVSTNFLTLARARPDFGAVLRGAGLAVIDGRVLLWLVRLTHPGGTFRQVTGHDLMREGAALAARRGYRLYFLGSAPGIAEEAAERLRREHPGIAIAADEGGRFARDGTPDDPAALIAAITRFRPHIIFVGLGAPKQELWIARYLEALPPAVAVGIGGVFDTLAGKLARAPRWMQVAGLEWLFRIAINPRRFARRYFVDDPPTLLRVLAAGLRRRIGGR